MFLVCIVVILDPLLRWLVLFRFSNCFLLVAGIFSIPKNLSVEFRGFLLLSQICGVM